MFAVPITILAALLAVAPTPTPTPWPVPQTMQGVMRDHQRMLKLEAQMRAVLRNRYHMSDRQLAEMTAAGDEMTDTTVAAVCAHRRAYDARVAAILRPSQLTLWKQRRVSMKAATATDSLKLSRALYADSVTAYELCRQTGSECTEAARLVSLSAKSVHIAEVNQLQNACPAETAKR